MRYTNIIFDLDGTITEPEEGIVNGVIYALSKFNIDVEDRKSLHRFIGPPLRDSFRDFYGLTEGETEAAVKYYREYYSVNGLVENELMPGMKNALITLNNVGCKLYVATSKPEIYAKKILENLGVLHLFQVVAGSLLDGSRDKKELVIAYLLDEAGIRLDSNYKDKTVMIGDRCFDVEGAKAMGLDNIGVTFGYGSREEFVQAGAMKIVDTAEEMTEYIIS